MCDRHCLTSISVEVEPISVPVAADGAVRLELTVEPVSQLEAKADSACSSAGHQSSSPQRPRSQMPSTNTVTSDRHPTTTALHQTQRNAMHTPCLFFSSLVAAAIYHALGFSARLSHCDTTHTTPPQIVHALNLSVSSHRVWICDYTRLPKSVREEENESEQ